MKNKLTPLAATALAVLLCSCATTSVEKTWKSPGAEGPVKKVAVLAVSDTPLVRPALEHRFAQDIAKQGAAAIITLDLLSLPQIKENKTAAAAVLREHGADSVLIVRLVDKTSYDQQVRASRSAYVPVATGYAGYGWAGYYDVAFMDMSVSYGSTRDYLVLDSSLFDLTTGQRLWSAVTKTVLKDDADRLVVADELVAKITAAMVKDGIIR